MRRLSHQVFRYIFPITLAGTVVILLHKDSITKDTNLAVSENFSDFLRTTDALSTSVKELQFFSQNPLDGKQLLIKAPLVQQKEKETIFLQPVGLFEQGTLKSSLTAKEASYSQVDKIVRFLNKVNFSHSKGLFATTCFAALNTKTHQISGDKGIKASHQQSTVEGNTYQIKAEQGTISVKGDAKLKVNFAQ